jgi:hypothetical protein
VHVDEEIRQPGPPQGQPGAHLDGVRLQVVAIEVQVRGVDPPAHLLGPVLVDAPPGREALVAVDVEDGDEQQRHALEQPFGERRVRGEVAQQQHPRILAARLAGMDARLHQHHEMLLAAIGQLRRREAPAQVGHDQRQGATLRARAEGRVLEQRGRGREILQPGNRFVIARCAAAPGGLVRRHRRRSAAGGRNRGHHGDDQRLEERPPKCRTESTRDHQERVRTCGVHRCDSSGRVQTGC